MSKSSLFRVAAVDAQKVQWLGDISLIRPISFSVFAGVAALMGSILVAFLLLGSYTKRTTVRGHLAPDTGVLKVYAPQPGIVLEKHVQEGQILKKGELLYLISSERNSSTTAGVQATISRQVAMREQSLRNELDYTRRLQRDQTSALHMKIEALQAERMNVANQLTGQRARVELAEAALHRAIRLAEQGFISFEMTQQRQADLLEQKNRMQSLERDRIKVEQELQTYKNDLESLPLHQGTQLAQLERLLTNTKQEWTESEGKRGIAIIAPVGGVGTTLNVEVGQSLDNSKPLLSIIPGDATLQAHVYAASRAIGFIRPGDKVLLRYHAYPYQKFGHAHGSVAYISRTAIPVAELPSELAVNEPLYRITVILSNQFVMAYGQARPLHPGMLVDADILHERRKLYEWALDPLFSLTGKL